MTWTANGIYVDATCTINGLTPETTYDLQLMSYRLENGVWEGARYSNLVTATTAPGS